MTVLVLTQTVVIGLVVVAAVLLVLGMGYGIVRHDTICESSGGNDNNNGEDDDLGAMLRAAYDRPIAKGDRQQFQN